MRIRPVRARSLGVVVTTLAAAAAVSFIGATSAAASGNGCPAGRICAYSTRAHFTGGTPDIISNNLPGDGFLSLGRSAVFYGYANNSSLYSSEGSYLLKLGLLGLRICVYVPASGDAQAPGSTQAPADLEDPVTVVAVGPTAASVASPILVGLQNCY